MSFPILNEIIEKKLYLFDESETDFCKAIRKSFSLLLQKGYVNNKYIDRVIESVDKYGPYFIFYDTVAVAHGPFSEDVYKSGLSICFFNKDIVYQERKARIFFALASKKTSKHEKIILELAKLLSDDKYLELFKDIKTVDELRNFANLTCDKNM